jgi:hypothetical protein
MSNERWTYQVLEMMPTFFRGRVSAERLHDELNRLGAQGWELVSVARTGVRATGVVQLYLKRAQ